MKFSGVLLSLALLLNSFGAMAAEGGPDHVERVDLVIGDALPAEANYLVGGISLNYRLPSRSINVRYEGRGWISFSWKDQCFLYFGKYVGHHRSSNQAASSIPISCDSQSRPIDEK